MKQEDGHNKVLFNNIIKQWEIINFTFVATSLHSYDYSLRKYVYDNDFRSIININFNEIFSTLTSENKCLSYIRIKALALLF
jgi:hypothetical protein